MSWNFKLRYYGDSQVGLRRSKNEDCYKIAEFSNNVFQSSQKKYLFAVADGIGGHAHGEIASRLACAELFSLRENEIPLQADDCKLFFEDLYFTIDAKLKAHAVHHHECQDMGTTLSCLLLTEQFAFLAHVGDSRIYRFRNELLEQLTTDHTFVQEMIDMGEEPPEAVMYHPLRSVLTRAVGTGERLAEVDTKVFSVTTGDRFLLCTDGLHDMLPFDQIHSAMKCKNPQASVAILVNGAIQNGGRDNVTVISVFLS